MLWGTRSCEGRAHRGNTSSAHRVAPVALACQHGAMARQIDLRILELLTARLCHDLAGPVAAISNGAELLDDEDPDFAREAAALIGESARTAAKRLQLFRYVYGWSPGAMAGPPPHLLAAEYFAGTSIECTYPGAVQ